MIDKKITDDFMMRPIRTRIEFEEKNIIKGWERSGTNFQLKLLKEWKSSKLKLISKLVSKQFSHLWKFYHMQANEP